MIPRYQAPMAQQLFDPKFMMGLWTSILRDQAIAVCPSDEIKKIIEGIKPPPWQSVVTREQTTGHDVVAFLQLILDPLEREAHQYVHLGLTSSDIVENALFYILRSHVEHMRGRVYMLIRTLKKHDREGAKMTLRPGRTHGQLAQAVSFEHQIRTFVNVADRLLQALDTTSANLRVTKSPGPVGQSPFRLPGPMAVSSTQVIPRDWLVEWADLYERLGVFCETLAMYVRAGARAEVGEFQEGASRVGSSAMAHKHNPVTSEKVCGLVRLVRGYHSSIVETAGNLWEDRDISNSSVERVAVPDMANLIEYMVEQMIGVIDNLVVDKARMKRNATNPECWTAVAQTTVQRNAKCGPIEAQNVVRVAANEVAAYRGDDDPVRRLAFFVPRLYKAVGETFGYEVAQAVDFDFQHAIEPIRG